MTERKAEKLSLTLIDGFLIVNFLILAKTDGFLSITKNSNRWVLRNSGTHADKATERLLSETGANLRSINAKGYKGMLMDTALRYSHGI